MPTDLRIVLPNRPGAAGQLFKVLGDEGINIEGACGDLRPGEKWAFVHVVVEDGAAAQRLVEAAGFQVTNTREVDLISVENRPGAFGELFQDLAEKELNVDILYTAANNRLVLGTEDMYPDRPGVRMADVRFP